jgi:hypothetical protein
MEVGQKIYMNCGHRRYVAGEVVRVTPSGLTDVKWGTDGLVISRFRKDGKRQGDSVYSAWTLDTEMPFDARTEYIRNGDVLDEAGRAINNIKVETVSFWYGRNFEKSDLLARLDKLQGEIDGIRALLAKAK